MQSLGKEVERTIIIVNISANEINREELVSAKLNNSQKSPLIARL
jgi:hypothetical protein